MGGLSPFVGRKEGQDKGGFALGPGTGIRMKKRAAMALLEKNPLNFQFGARG